MSDRQRETADTGASRLIEKYERLAAIDSARYVRAVDVIADLRGLVIPARSDHMTCGGRVIPPREGGRRG